MTDGPAPADRRALDDARARAANEGDRGAAGEYLADNLPHLLYMARWIANGVIDHEDLASDAITALLGVWAQGTGPTTNPNTYVARSMRNRVIDEYRSPRSRVRGVIDADAEMTPHVDSTRDADLHREYRYVTSALRSLPTDQQQVLVGVVIDGRKPAELEAELGRPASAIYSLVRRAKVGLRRATLREILEDGAPEECRRAARRLPETVTELVDDAPDSRGMSHVRTCARCRAAWARFGALTTLFGVIPLFVVGSVLDAPSPAQADEGRGPDAERAPDAPSARRTPRTPSAMSGAVVRWWSRVPASTSRALAILSIVTGVGLLVLAGVQQFLPAGADPRGSFSVTSHAVGEGRAEIDVALDLEAAEDVRLVLILPAGMAVVEVPEGWDCTTGPAGAVCLADGGGDGRFVLSDTRPDDEGRYSLSLSGRMDDRDVTGRAQGELRSTPQTVQAFVG